MRYRLGNVRAALVALGLCVIAGFAASAQNPDDNPQTADEGGNPVQMTLSRQAPGQYEPGNTLTITITIDAPLSGDITAMGLTEYIPDGWSFNGPGELMSGVLPSVTPAPGAQGQLDFAWIVIPQNEFPFVFSYLLDVPAGAAGPQAINGFVEYRMQGPAHFSNEAVTQLAGYDKQPPVITLNVENPMTIVIGESYDQPVATATDNVDQNVKVTASGSFDPTTPGTYSITYTARDSSGNNAAPVTLSIVVKKGSNSNNGGNTGGGGTSTPRYYGGGGIYMPDEDLAGRTAVGEGNAAGQEGTPQTPANGPAAGRPALNDGSSIPTAASRMPVVPSVNPMPVPNVAPPGGNSPPITPTTAGATPREFGKPRLRREGEPETKPVPPADPAATATAAPAPPEVTETTPPAAPESEAIVVAQAAQAGEPAPADGPATEEPAKPGFFGAIAAAFGGLSTQERLGLGVAIGIMIVIVVLSLIAYKFAYKPGPRRRAR
ncbi:MAG: DUF5011 domain-containing protein [Candidatus Hydrogenedentes bacterium]|nr:DUF5011 domain-containing protein [Candidatus Hydrogenedentota bacterium]